MLVPRSPLREEERKKRAKIGRKDTIRAKIGHHVVGYCMQKDAERARFGVDERVSPSGAKGSISRSLAAAFFGETHVMEETERTLL